MNEHQVLPLLKSLPDVKNLSARWDEFENRFGVELPFAFKALTDKGIPLELFHFLFIINPFTENGDFPLENNPAVEFIQSEAEVVESEFDGLDDESSNILESVFPIGGTENADVLLLIKKQGNWQVAVADSHYFEIEYFEMDLAQFLIEFITGRLRPRSFPQQILSKQGWPLQSI